MREAKREFILRQAVDYYNKLMEDEELTNSSKMILNNSLEKAHLIFDGRRLISYLRPNFVLESDWKHISSICETIFRILQKVANAALNSSELLDELGVTEVEKELVSIDTKYRQASPISRLDSFLTRGFYSFVELNGETPAGIAFADSATNIFLQLPLMKKFMENFEVRWFEGRLNLLDTLLKCYEEFLGHKPEKKPTIAIVDLKDLPTVEEFKLCLDFFEENGCKSVICSPDELEFSNGKLRVNGEIIDMVYRRLLVCDYLPIINECPSLLSAYKSGDVCVVNSFRAILLHKKAMFAVLTNEKYSGLFTESELFAIREHVPWTRNFCGKKSINNGKEVDLVNWTRTNSHKLVLKPNNDYGGHGIYIGWSSDEREWDQAIEKALTVGDYLVQERVETAKDIFPCIDNHGSIRMREQMVDLDPLLFNGKTGAAFTRLSTTELANVSSGGGMVPTFILKGK